jgi:hypothetical protein
MKKFGIILLIFAFLFAISPMAYARSSGSHSYSAHRSSFSTKSSVSKSLSNSKSAKTYNVKKTKLDTRAKGTGKMPKKVAKPVKQTTKAIKTPIKTTKAIKTPIKTTKAVHKTIVVKHTTVYANPHGYTHFYHGRPYTYNPFSGDFWFWMWLFNEFDED